MKNNLFIVIALVLLLIIISYVVGIREVASIAVSLYGGEKELADAGLLGDSTGAINSLFSALAFGGVILTIYWQITSESEQRRETHRMQFENAFFQMTSTLETIIDGLTEKIEASYSNTDTIYSNSNTSDSNENSCVDNSEIPVIKGRELFKHIYTSRILLKCDNYNGFDLVVNPTESDVKVPIGDSLNHYFRYLYHILKYIDTSRIITDEQKYEYASILRAHLSTYELILLFYNGLSSNGRDKMKPLMEKYAMLNNLTKDDFQTDEEKELYDEMIKGEISDGIYYSKSTFEHNSLEKHIGKELTIKSILYSAIGICSLCASTTIIERYIIEDFMQYIPDGNLELLLLLFSLWGLYVYREYCKKEKSLAMQSQCSKYTDCLDIEKTAIGVAIMVVYLFGIKAFNEYHYFGWAIPYHSCIPFFSLTEIGIAFFVYHEHKSTPCICEEERHMAADTT